MLVFFLTFEHLLNVILTFFPTHFRYCPLTLQPLLTESTVHINNSKKSFDKNDFVTKLCWRAVSETFLACFENHFTFLEEPTADANNFIFKSKTFQRKAKRPVLKMIN